MLTLPHDRAMDEPASLMQEKHLLPQSFGVAQKCNTKQFDVRQPMCEGSGEYHSSAAEGAVAPSSAEQLDAVKKHVALSSLTEPQPTPVVLIDLSLSLFSHLRCLG
jgi:hypothetical protein